MSTYPVLGWILFTAGYVGLLAGVFGAVKRLPTVLAAAIGALGLILLADAGMVSTHTYVFVAAAALATLSTVGAVGHRRRAAMYGALNIVPAE